MLSIRLPAILWRLQQETPLTYPSILRSARVLVVALLLFFCSTAQATVTITLKNDFIEKYKNRTTIDANYTVVKTHHKAKPAKDDGDIHCAGTAPEVGLNTVAEMMNAKSQPAAVNMIVGAEGSGNALPITGVWRIWSEHGGDSTQKQGGTLEPIVSTNPDHVFEIHPITTVGGVDVSPTFKKISGYKYKDAEQAFLRYEGLDSHLTCGPNTTTLRTGQAGYNYVDFVMELLEDPTHESQTVSPSSPLFSTSMVSCSCGSAAWCS